MLIKIHQIIVLLLFQLAAQQRYADFQRSNWEQINKIDQGVIFDESIYREVKLISTIGTAALPPDQLDRVSNHSINEMLIDLLI